MSTEAISSAATLWDAYLPSGTYDNDVPPAQFRDFNLDPTHPDSYVSRFGAPEGFYTAPSALSKETFLSWHSEAQLEYIYANLTDKSGILTIGTGTDTIDAMLSSVKNAATGAFIIDPTNPNNSTTVILINYLTVETLGFINQADTDRLNNNITYQTLIATLGLVTAFGTYNTSTGKFTFFDTSSPIAKLYKFLNDISDTLVNDTNITDAMEVLIRDSKKSNASANMKNLGLIAQDALDAIKAQMDALVDAVLGNDRKGAVGVFSPEQINTDAQEILKSFDTLNTFARTLKQLDGTDLNNAAGSINAADKTTQIAGLTASFANLTRAATAKTEALTASSRIVDGTATNLLGKPLDGPGLLSAFVFNLSLKLQAQNQFDTELFNQLNTLIKSYGVMQRLINETLARFDASDSDQKLSISYSSNDDEVVAALVMFEHVGFIENPIEVLENVERPDFGTALISQKDREQWTTLLQQLNDAVTLLNQNSQLQFNEITTRSQQRTVFFEAASDALTKIDDILGSIGRNMG